ncbi:hypothetical protein V2J09_017764 [Rumex salicifolius]
MAKWVGVLFAALLFLTFAGQSMGSTIGVCYGRNADDLSTPDKVAQLVQQHKIKAVRIYDSNIQVLKAFSNTGVELMIGVFNSDLLALSQFQSNADTWLRNSILPYYPAAKITYITVGAEVTEDPNNVSAMVVHAMQNIFTALKKAGGNLHKKIKVSTTHSLGVMSRSYPPSAGAFDSKYAFFLRPLLEFLAENESPFMVDIYPYYAYRDSPSNVSLDYAMFESSSEVVDPNTGLLYTNMFDAQIDALYYALMALNFRTIKIMVTETGWPSKGAPKETAATPDNAQTYNNNLIRHVINNTGTPAKPGEELDVYLFSLFNENRKPGIESERNWGLFYPDETSVYTLDFQGNGEVGDDGGVNSTTTNSTMGTSWCIASSTASEMDLQSALDWACGSGNVDCTAIQPSQPCYEPDTLLSHASYAFNSYYQQNGATETACSFSGAGVKVAKNPSYDRCIYMTTGSNKTVSSNTTIADATASYSAKKNTSDAWIFGCLLIPSAPLFTFIYRVFKFDRKYAFFLSPILEFLAENESPFMVDIYPYCTYRDTLSNVSLDYALLESSSEVVDLNTGLLHNNMFDAHIDALYYSLMAFNSRSIKITVTETGWPSKGAPKETDATLHNAQTKPGIESGRNWGLFYPDKTSVYTLDFQRNGEVGDDGGVNSTTTNSAMGTLWCIASSTASEMDLQSALDWASGSGNISCISILPSQPCYEPDTLLSHASYAFNNYYQQNGATETACSFSSVGVNVAKNPKATRLFRATPPLLMLPHPTRRRRTLLMLGFLDACS